MNYIVNDKSQQLIGNELFVYAINAYGFLLPEGEDTTVGKFADRIADFYHVDEGRNKEVYDFLKRFSGVKLTCQPNLV